MDPSFDPYHKWLGIPPHEQPANLYRLLGVALFEPDLDVISSAADQRMAHLRSFQTGAHAAHSQKLLNEVSRARVRLLDFNQKAAYDAELRSAIARVTGGASGKPGPATAKKVTPTRKAQPAPRRTSGSMDVRRDLPHPIHAEEDAEDEFEIVDDSLPDLSETAASVVLASPRPVISTANRPTATHRPPARRGNRTVYGIVTGGILGLVIGYLLLTNLNPKADFLGLFPDRETSSSEAIAKDSTTAQDSPVEQPAKPAPKKPADAPAPSPSKPATTQSGSETPAAQPETETTPKPRPPKIKTRPKSKPSAEPAKKVDPITRLPKTFGLPKLNDAEPAILANLEDADAIKIDSLELFAKLADSSAQNLAAQAESPDGKASQWLIGFAKEGKITAPLARLRCDEKALEFRWDKAAATTPLAAHVANSLLRLSVAGKEHTIALRKPVQLPPIVLDMAQKETTHRVLDAPLPKADTIWLEVLGLDRFPVRAKYKNDKPKAVFRKDAMSTVAIALDKLNNADFPEIQLRLVPTTGGGIDVKVVRALITPRGTFELTRSKVQEVRTLAEGRLKPIEQDIPNVTRDMQTAKRSFETVQAQPAVGVYNIAYKQQRLNALRAQINTLNAQLTRLNKEKAELLKVLKGVPPVESLVSQLDSAKIEIRIYSQSGDVQLDLATTGDDSLTVTTSSATNEDAPLLITPKRAD